MNEQNSHLECLETTAQVLVRCLVGGIILLLVWFVAFLAATDWMYAMNARWFSITRDQFVMVNFCGIAALKIFVYVVFLVPYISVRLVLRKNRIKR
jgi:hypothetical protein